MRFKLDHSGSPDVLAHATKATELAVAEVDRLRMLAIATLTSLRILRNRIGINDKSIRDKMTEIIDDIHETLGR